MWLLETKIKLGYHHSVVVTVYSYNQPMVINTACAQTCVNGEWIRITSARNGCYRCVVREGLSGLALINRSAVLTDWDVDKPGRSCVPTSLDM